MPMSSCGWTRARRSRTTRSGAGFGERLSKYRRYGYEIGSQPSEKGARIEEAILEKEESKGFRVGGINRLLLRTRYFPYSGILGTKEFVPPYCKLFKDHFTSRHEKRPRPIAGLDGVYSLKRLAEATPEPSASPIFSGDLWKASRPEKVTPCASRSPELHL